MSNKPKESLDRRDFMIGLIATVGAPAVLAANAGSANAQDSATSSVRPAPGAPATVYTGDVIQGKKVVSVLDVNDLEPGKKHLLYFQGVQMPTGQHWYVSVIVAKGGQAGQARRPGQWRAWRRDEFCAYGPDRDEPTRSGRDVGHGDGGHGRVQPGHGRHAAQMAQFGQGH
jgi:hypothetical protein